MVSDIDLIAINALNNGDPILLNLTTLRLRTYGLLIYAVYTSSLRFTPDPLTIPAANPPLEGNTYFTI